MSWLYRNAIRPVLFAQEAESVHNRTIQTLGRVSRGGLALEVLGSFFRAPALPVELFGLRFPNPVGLAAGMDKNAEALPAWAALGFGFTELGAATWHAQPGNPSPRVFRARTENAIVNRMGFNNRGAEAIAEKLADWRNLGRWPRHPVGMNLGKSKITPLEKAAEDYASSFRVLRPHLDFFVVNVSSPNTPNLRQLQDKKALDEILHALQEVNGTAGAESVVSSQWSVAREQGQGTAGTTTDPGPRATDSKPILVKVAPDLTFEALDEILELVGPRQIAGIVATNTTIGRPQSSDPEVQRIYAETGGLSGRPLQARSTEIVRHLYRQTKGRLPIIGVGGIFSAADAWEKIAAGASLVQLYTGLVYEGPGVVKDITEGLIERLETHSFKELREAVGCQAG
jgi:dihydroorotate dehydrogenase